MHPQKLIDTVVEFEKDLAAFYRRLEKIDRFEKLHKIFQFMHKHSDIHAELMSNFRSDAGLPSLNIDPLHALHAKIKSALSDQLMAAEALGDVYSKLAQAEALISQIYTAISLHYQKMADVYSKMSHNFKNLADDEMQHHRHIETERDFFMKTEGF